MGELYPRHEKQTRNPAETTGNRYKIEFLMSQTQKLKGLVDASLILKTLNDNPYVCTTTYVTPRTRTDNACLMSCCQGLSLPFIAIPTLPKLLCVFMVLPLSVSMMNKVMKQKW